MGGTEGPCKHAESGLCFDYHHADKDLECEDGLIDCAWSGQLTLKKGTLVVVPTHQNLNAKWWTVISETHHKGLFPSAYLVPGSMSPEDEAALLESVSDLTAEELEDGSGENYEDISVSSKEANDDNDAGSSALVLSFLLFGVVAAGVAYVIQSKRKASAALNAKRF